MGIAVHSTGISGFYTIILFLNNVHNQGLKNMVHFAPAAWNHFFGGYELNRYSWEQS